MPAQYVGHLLHWSRQDFTYVLYTCMLQTVADITDLGFDYKIWAFWGPDVSLLEQH